MDTQIIVTHETVTALPHSCLYCYTAAKLCVAKTASDIPWTVTGKTLQYHILRTKAGSSSSFRSVDTPVA